jgi:hypothetical protein
MCQSPGTPGGRSSPRISSLGRQLATKVIERIAFRLDGVAAGRIPIVQSGESSRRGDGFEVGDDWSPHVLSSRTGAPSPKSIS